MLPLRTAVETFFAVAGCREIATFANFNLPFSIVTFEHSSVVKIQLPVGKESDVNADAIELKVKPISQSLYGLVIIFALLTLRT